MSFRPFQPFRAFGGGAALDPDISAFVAATGATDIATLTALTAYLKAQSLWANCRFYPCKSTQNHPSGTVLKGLGGITSNDMTLYGSPTFGTGGMAMNATTQYGAVADFLDNSTHTVFVRRSGATGEVNGYIVAQYDFAAGERSWALCTGSTTDMLMVRDSLGTAIAVERYSNAGSFSTSDYTWVAQWVAGGGRALWKNKTSLGLTLVAGSAQTTRLNSADPLMINCIGVPGAISRPSGGTYIAVLVVQGSLTTTQREAITDYLNAL
jgi:hypothetical protein